MVGWNCRITPTMRWRSGWNRDMDTNPLEVVVAFLTSYRPQETMAASTGSSLNSTVPPLPVPTCVHFFFLPGDVLGAFVLTFGLSGFD